MAQTKAQRRAMAEMLALVRDAEASAVRSGSLAGAESQKRAKQNKEPRPRRASASLATACPNASVYLTAANETSPSPVECVPTLDPSDRAHVRFELQRDGLPYLVPAAELGGNARPRRYPRSQMTPAGVAVDSMFDGLHQRERRLAGIMGIGIQDHLTAADLRDQWGEPGPGPEGLRGIIDVNRRSFRVSTVGTLARRYYANGLISEAECEKLREADADDPP